MMRPVLVAGLGLEVLDLDEGLIEHITFLILCSFYHLIFHCLARLWCLGDSRGFCLSTWALCFGFYDIYPIMHVSHSL